MLFSGCIPKSVAMKGCMVIGMLLYTTIHPNSDRLFTPGRASRGYVTLIAPCPCTPQGAVRAHCSSAAAGNGRER